MSSIIISDKDTINVYKFMEMCGLKCEVKRNVNISHKIMLKKLCLRHSLFPSKVVIPKRISYSKINNEDIRRGKIVIVKDDYEKKIAYSNPIDFNSDMFLMSLKYMEKENIDEDLEHLKNKEEQELKPGYIKYLTKKANRQEKMEQEDIEKGKEESLDEEYYNIKEKARVKKYQRKGFGRRY